jgi:hypothetical protein
MGVPLGALGLGAAGGAAGGVPATASASASSMLRGFASTDGSATARAAIPRRPRAATTALRRGASRARGLPPCASSVAPHARSLAPARAAIALVVQGLSGRPRKESAFSVGESLLS